jgi:aspartate kinase
VAGFQGMSYRREITTLGRGGSDTTAVALAAALNAESCEICGDVDGIYSADPKVVASARHIDQLGYAEMQEMAESGAIVLNATAVEFAKEKNIALFVRRTDGQGGHTIVRRHTTYGPGHVVGVAHEESIRIIECEGPKEKLDELLAFLDEHKIAGKQLTAKQINSIWNTSVVVSKDQLFNTTECKANLLASFSSGVCIRDDLGAVSLIGAGINQNFKNLQKARKLLVKKQVPVVGWHTSSFRITLLIASKDVVQTADLLHKAFIS